MRRIDLRKLNPSPDWRTRAQNKQSDIDNQVIEAKTASGIWSELKPLLKELSADKCWYCESREDRSDNSVDHFRPKSLYPWFALDYENFRFACTFCNSIRNNPETGESGGKGNHFPLLSGSRASDRAQRNTEDYLLIDPCEASDVGLLDFTEDGLPRAKYPNQTNRNRRAVDSIRYYHLNHPDLVEARRLLALDIREWVESAEAIYNSNDQGDPRTEKAFKGYVSSIAKAISADAPFSVFAKKMVKGYQDRDWIEVLLECA
ncbi:MAG: HNH endonuclease [Gammaproteobacteria bacterium HGW-Gammaproteobacteria-15]|nr:MAG: HNH endonuclease [Gammaproteobacteria bacterium HGW-Gammaproteobacteria-15]